MKSTQQLSRQRLRGLLVLGTSLAAFAAGEAFAQAPEPGVDLISVTGTRIKREDLIAASPVAILDREALDISGINAVQTILNELPQTGVPAVTDVNSNFNVSTTGANFVNLRNLGSNRTLVLVNGRRHVGGSAGDPAVDVSMIPAQLVERIDVVTGGASAVYGSEAVAGVINLILKDDFEGVQTNLRYGESTQGGAREIDFNITAGGNFADGRGNAVLYAGYSDRGVLEAKDREISEGDAVNSSFGPFGSIQVPGGGFLTLDRDTGLFNKPFVNAEDGFDRNAVRLIRVPTERFQANANVTYDVNDYITFFSETGFNSVESTARLEPTIIGQFISVGGINNINMPVDNPFLPAETLALITAADPTVDEVTFRRRFTELGPRRSDSQRSTFRQAIGIEGQLPESLGGFGYEAYYQIGRLTQDQQNAGIANTLNVFNALRTEPDGAGGFQCADELSRDLGCVPINFFGANTVTGDALAFVNTTAQTTARAEQQVAGLTFTGNAFELPAGPLGFATGIEWREEDASFRTDALAATGLTTSNTSPSINGRYSIVEGFVEVNVPILADLPGADYLGFEGAVRYGDYSTVGGVVAYKAAATWRPVPELTLRGGYNTAVRAPFINELFDPGSETFRNYIDPCNFGGAGGASADGRTTYTAESAEVQARCATIPGTATLDQGAVNIFSAGGFAAGNPDLSEEVSETITLGLVYQSSRIPGLNITIDYYDIVIEDAIRNFTAQDTVTQCVRQGDFPNNPFCTLIERNPTTGLIERINALDINNAEEIATGVDFTADYAWDMGGIGWRVNMTGNYTSENSLLAFEGGNILDDAGEVGVPEWSAVGSLVADWEKVRVAWSTRFIDGVNIDNEDPTAGPADANGKIDAFWYHDINVNYEVNETFNLAVGVDNLFDEEPPFLGQGVNGDVTGTNTAADVYDPIGRFVYVNLQANF